MMSATRCAALHGPPRTHIPQPLIEEPFMIRARARRKTADPSVITEHFRTLTLPENLDLRARQLAVVRDQFDDLKAARAAEIAGRERAIAEKEAELDALLKEEAGYRAQIEAREEAEQEAEIMAETEIEMKIAPDRTETPEEEIGPVVASTVEGKPEHAEDGNACLAASGPAPSAPAAAKEDQRVSSDASVSMETADGAFAVEIQAHARAHATTLEVLDAKEAELDCALLDAQARWRELRAILGLEARGAQEIPRSDRDEIERVESFEPV